MNNKLGNLANTGMEGRPPTPAVLVQNGYKAYNKNHPILNDFNMTVRRGTIYGLLGASGCGKTTMLSCIVGLRHMDAGEIRVFGARPGTKESGIPGKRLGYMPQDIALYPMFTIQELLTYFGTIYGMDYFQIINRISFLSSFLQLPDATRLVRNLSGGQQRRTSLATALIHDPELLILDEPTVGVDPLLRESIWDHLVSLTESGRTTIIITTHYIEEARQSHNVGLMRNGRLLCEKSPETLLIEHNANLLEDIVLQLCRKDESLLTSSIAASTPTADPVRKALAESSFYPVRRFLPKSKKTYNVQEAQDVLGLKFQGRNPSIYPTTGPNRRRSSVLQVVEADVNLRMSRIKAVMVRNVINFIRNPIFLVGLILLPAFQQILSCSTLGKEVKHMKFGVINDEVPDWQETCPGINVGCKSGIYKNFSCRYLNALPTEVFDLQPFKTKEDAIHAVGQGDLWGYLRIPDNYTRYMTLRASEGNFAGNETLVGSTLGASMDYSSYIASLLLLRGLFNSLQKYLLGIGVECGADPKQFELPFNYRTPVYGTLEPSYLEYGIPGGLTMLIYLIPMCTCALAYIADKKQGTLERSRSAGVTTFEFMIAFFFTEGIVIMLEVFLSTGILVAFFDFEIRGSVVLFTVLMVLVGLSGQSWGFILGLVCESETSALLCVFFMVPVLSVTGVTWPLEAVPKAIQMVANFIPVTLPLASMRSIVIRGLGITHGMVWPGFGVSFLSIIITWAFSGLVYRYTK